MLSHDSTIENISYPLIDAGNGGDIEGMIRFFEEVSEHLNEGSIVVPGHGPVLAYSDMEDYISMLKTVRGRINTLISQGKSLEEVITEKPAAEFDEQYGDPGMLIDRAYMSLSR